MAIKAELVGGLTKLRVIVCPMNIVAGGTGHSMLVHHTLHEIVALDPVLVSRAVGVMDEVSLPESDVFELPTICKAQTDVIANRPVVGFAIE